MVVVELVEQRYKAVIEALDGATVTDVEVVECGVPGAVAFLSTSVG